MRINIERLSRESCKLLALDVPLLTSMKFADDGFGENPKVAMPDDNMSLKVMIFIAESRR